MVGKIKTRNEEETKEMVYDIRREIASYHNKNPFLDFEDDENNVGVMIAFHKDQKIIAIDDEVIPEDDEYNVVFEEIEKITKVSWDSWGFNRDFEGLYYYIYVDEIKEN